MPTHATALFADRHSAHAAVEQLAQAGFPRDAISVAMSEDTHDREFGASSSALSGVRPRIAGVLGAIVGGLVVVGAPGGLALRAAGPVVTALLRAGALSAGLVALGLAEREARAVDEGLRGGSIVVGVQAAPDRLATAMQLLELSGGAGLRAA